MFFDTVDECRQYFNEKTHRFITTRVTNKIHGLYNNEWKIAYNNDEYGEYKEQRHKKGILVQVTNLLTSESNIIDSIRLTARKYNVSRNEIYKNIREGNNDFIINNLKFTILD